MVSRLRENGYDITAAENGAQALTAVREQRFDLILIDAAPGSGLGGVELCRRLKQIRPSLEIPTLLLSKSTSREEAPRAFEAGCDAFLTKADLPVLEPILRGFVRAKRTFDELRIRTHTLEQQVQRMAAERSHAGHAGEAETAHQNGKAYTANGHAANGHGAVGPASVWRDIAIAKPDGVLLVDDEGIVRMTDRGAQELFGGLIDGRALSRLAPTSGLEAFVRDVHSEQREGLRFDLPSKNGRQVRSLLASVAPIIPKSGERDDGLRVVILLDMARRKLATELIGLQEYTLPRAEVGVLRQAARFAYSAVNLAGPGAAMTRVRERVRELGATQAPVLLIGPAGSGRQHLARALHFGSEHGGPFLPVACAGLTAEHLEAELFGQVKGAFADALVDRPGALQHAGRGTVYIADVDTLPLGLQRKLVRALRDRVVTRAGTDRTEPIEARIILSTTGELGKLVDNYAFDPELAELLRTRITLPSLAERPEDLRALTEHFLRMFGSDRPELEISPEALYAIEHYSWPGNVLELRSCIERACRQATGDVIEQEHLTAPLREVQPEFDEHEIVPAHNPLRIVSGVTSPAEESHFAARNGFRARAPGEVGQEDPINLDHYEMKCLERALAATGGDKLAAARMLKVGKSTLYRKLKRYNIA
jgi:DNA-binding NtrC family response regulator